MVERSDSGERQENLNDYAFSCKSNSNFHSIPLVLGGFPGNLIIDSGSDTNLIEVGITETA